MKAMPPTVHFGPDIGSYFYRNIAIVVGLVLVVILVGYYRLFQGANFFVEEDPITVYNLIHGNVVGNGWRPEKGFGLSFFFGDPGAAHPWSVYVLWERLVGNGLLAYNLSILALLISATVALYFFLRRVVPGIGAVAVFLAPLIVFGPLQHEFFFQRHWISLSIGTPLLLMLLYDYFQTQRIIFLFRGALLFWFVWFFGSYASFIQLAIVGVVFSFIYYLWHLKSLKLHLRLCISFYGFAMLWVVLLGAWVFYSLVIQSIHVGYVREPVYFLSGTFNIKTAVECILSLFSCGWLPWDMTLIGSEKLLTPGWTICCTVFPMVLISVLFRKAQTFWEFALKWLLIIFLVHEFMMRTTPIYHNTVGMLWNGYPLLKFQPAYHVFEIGLMAMFVNSICVDNQTSRLCITQKILRTTACVLAFFYGVLAIINVIALVRFAALPTMVSKILGGLISEGWGGYSEDLLRRAMVFNFESLQKGMGWQSLGFYSMTAVIFALFSKRRGHLFITQMGGMWFSIILLVNGILLSWIVYPLNSKVIIWESALMEPVSNAIRVTDRYYYFDDQSLRVTDTESFNKYYLGSAEASANSYVGMLDNRGNNISSAKSFSQVDVANYEFEAFGGLACLPSLRAIEGGPVITSPLLDVGAVSHYYSVRELNDVPEGLSAYFIEGPLYIYKNEKAWPYYYLANETIMINDIKEMKGPPNSGVYLFANEYYPLEKKNSIGSVQMTAFSYGSMEFDYSGESENMLVVADAWHPFWKAKIDGMEQNVIKANGIFKGVILPSGKHNIEMYFDTSPHYPGIYISIIAGILFISVYVFARRKGA